MRAVIHADDSPFVVFTFRDSNICIRSNQEGLIGDQGSLSLAYFFLLDQSPLLLASIRINSGKYQGVHPGAAFISLYKPVSSPSLTNRSLYSRL